MSTILDALKRSEQERKLSNLPTLSDMPAPHERSRWPLILLGAILATVLVGLIWILMAAGWFGDDRSPAMTPARAQESSQDSQAEMQDNQAATDIESQSIVVSVVSYSQDPAVRFAIINGKLFREDQFVKAGVKVESILADSVVLIERGERITLRP
jgi:cytoskeletal protein RodZ